MFLVSDGQEEEFHVKSMQLITNYFFSRFKSQ